MNDVFKTVFSDEICKHLSLSNFKEIIFEKTKDNNIIKIETQDKFKWESFVYLYFINYSIFPLMTANNLSILYYTADFKPFREKCVKKYKKQIINEVFNFVNGFKKIKFVHGNLCIDNVFFDYDYIYVIDLSNSYILDFVDNVSYNRKSFLKESKTYSDLVYWDIFTLYISMKKYMNDINDILYLNKIIIEYIPYNILSDMISRFIVF